MIGATPSPRAVWQWGFIAVLLTLGVVPAFLNPVNGDIAWLLYAARRVTEGATLYVDLIEINPPLIVWLSIPAVWVADLLGTSTMTAFTGGVVVLAGGSLALVYRLLRAGSALAPSSCRGFVALFTLSAVTFSGIMFGQREQLMLLATAPYATLMAVRIRGGAVAARLALYVGVLAGIGFALKPHFLLIWLGLEALARHAQPGHRICRPEVLGVVGIGGLYVLSVALYAPEYLTTLDRLGALYIGHRQETLGELAMKPITMALLVGLLFHRLADPSDEVDALVTVSATFGATALTIVAIQGQGFYYHYYPVLTWVVVLIGLESWANLRVSRASGRSPWWGAWAPATVLLVVLAGAAGESALSDVLRRDYDRRLDRVAEHLRTVASSESLTVAVISPQHKSGFPLVNRAGARSVLRFNGFWPITALCDGACRGNGEYLDGSIRPASEAEAYFRRGIIEDLTSTPPDVLLFDEREIRETFSDRPFDYVGYLASNRHVRSILSGYVCALRLGGYLICHRRQAPETALPGGAGGVGATHGARSLAICKVERRAGRTRARSHGRVTSCKSIY